MDSGSWAFTGNPVRGHWPEVRLPNPVKHHWIQQQQHDLSSVDVALHFYKTPSPPSSLVNPALSDANTQETAVRGEGTNLSSGTRVQELWGGLSACPCPSPTAPPVFSSWQALLNASAVGPTSRPSPSFSELSESSQPCANKSFISEHINALASAKFHCSLLFFLQYLSEVKFEYSCVRIIFTCCSLIYF